MIYITGDTHIPIDVNKLNTRNWPQQKKLTSNDNLIICGDFGLVWYPPEHKDYKTDLHWKKWLEAKPYNILWVDGNHENFDLLATYPIVEKFGAPVHQIGKNIFHLIRGNIYTINDKKVFAFGGARSHDRGPGDAWWWEQEQATLDEMQFGVDNLMKHDFKVDLVITHDGPREIVQIMKRFELEPDATNKYLEFLAKNGLKFTDWYFGHHHDNIDYSKYHMIYDKIVKID